MNRRRFALAGLALLPATATTTALAKPRQPATDTQRAEPDAGGRGTKHKNRKKPKPKVVTRTFSSTRAITIPGTGETGPAAPYLSTIEVSGLTKGRILDVNLKLHGFSHEHPRDVELLLVSPSGRAALVMSDAGGIEPVNDLTITLDDQAAAPLPEYTTLTSGSFRPANHGTASPGDDDFPAPAPQGVTNSSLSIFRGAKPNGRWRLFVNDDSDGDTGSITGGWSLTIKARVRSRG